MAYLQKYLNSEFPTYELNFAMKTAFPNSRHKDFLKY